MQGVSLCCQYEIRKPVEPGFNVQRLVCPFELRVVVLAAALDEERKRSEARLSGALCQRLLCDGPADPAVAVFERMNALEVEVRESGACQRRQRRFARWARGIEPATEPLHLGSNRRGGRRLEVDLGCIDLSRNHLHRFWVFPVITDGA